MNILILSWPHPYDVVNGVSLLIAKGLSKLGANVTIVNPRVQQGQDFILKHAQEKNIDLIIGMNPHAFSFRISNQTIFEIIKTRYATFYLDNPIYSLSLLDNLCTKMPDDSIFIFIDSVQAGQMRGYFKRKHQNRFFTKFIPYGTWVSNDEGLNIKKTSDLVIFANLDQELNQFIASNDNYSGNFQLPERLNEIFKFQINKIQSLAQHFSSQGFCEDPLFILEKHLGFENIITDPALTYVATAFDSYLKRYRRFNSVKELINATTNSNFKVSIYGTGWENLNLPSKNFTVHKPVKYDSQFEIFKKSKVMLNLDPNWSSGVHDRVFNAISSQCAVLTNQNKFTDMYFTNCYNSMLYNNLGQLSERFYQAVESSDYLVNTANKTLLLEHTWEIKLKSLIDCIG